MSRRCSPLPASAPAARSRRSRPTVPLAIGRKRPGSVRLRPGLRRASFSSRLFLRGDTEAGGVEDVDVLGLRNERRLLAGRRRFAAADLGDEQFVVGTTQMGKGGFAEPFDELDDAF